MSIFDPVVLEWRDNEYTVAAEKVMGLIGAVEQHVTLQRLLGNPGHSEVATGYWAALRYAGCRVDREEVYGALFADAGTRYIQIGQQLALMMIPPEHLQGSGKEDDSGNQQAAEA